MQSCSARKNEVNHISSQIAPGRPMLCCEYPVCLLGPPKHRLDPSKSDSSELRLKPAKLVTGTSQRQLARRRPKFIEEESKDMSLKSLLAAAV